jgi:hypothetical protein
MPESALRRQRCVTRKQDVIPNLKDEIGRSDFKLWVLTDWLDRVESLGFTVKIITTAEVAVREWKMDMALCDYNGRAVSHL